jgi:hypothetical protein
LPVAVALAVRRAELGAFAAEQRAVASSVPARLLSHDSSGGRGVTYADVMAAATIHRTARVPERVYASSAS